MSDLLSDYLYMQASLMHSDDDRIRFPWLLTQMFYMGRNWAVRELNASGTGPTSFPGFA